MVAFYLVSVVPSSSMFIAAILFCLLSLIPLGAMAQRLARAMAVAAVGALAASVYAVWCCCAGWMCILFP